MPLSVYVLGFGIFTQGTSEFMLSGLLPDLADDLGVSIPAAGLLISAFAVGMVIGAPLLAITTLRWPRRTALVALQGVFVLAHIVGAMATTYELLFATRVISALVYAGCFGVALATAVSLVPPGSTGKAVATVAGGLTLATIVGVPAGTLLSQYAGWRAAFWAVAAATMVSLLWTAFAIPGGRADGEPPRSARAELRGMKRPHLWLSYAITAFTFGAVIVTFSYLASVLTEVSGLADAWVPGVLALFGVGGLLGITLGSRWAQTHPLRTLLWGLVGLMIVSALIALTARHTAVTVVLVFFLGFVAWVTNPALQARVYALAPEAPTLVGATNTAAFNVGNTLAPMLGGLVISTGHGFASVAWVGVALAATGCLATLWAWRLSGRTPAPAVTSPPVPGDTGSTPAGGPRRAALTHTGT
ncbi:Cmx/CmrA family chloramphenicol efflux MFS transporter [Streptomyces zagrosensis]|uniref:DHA1 family chloramphenicol resistance protein-like MFS transporter n=1 Tax=Streptomyces zagrosensis TaxID=1042984 RepID=A0A7W9UX97_9ACTN|nr:Cmx/CmrA family chloramphenicol efflux MFS transporter [Streptomyces zagrosensis]MBB5934668.1 DHA1 family chloramphenicol resistance protein-like MFS transporter [Streptomyces zagrosensis]